MGVAPGVPGVAPRTGTFLLIHFSWRSFSFAASFCAFSIVSLSFSVSATALMRSMRASRSAWRRSSFRSESSTGPFQVARSFSRCASCSFLDLVGGLLGLVCSVRLGLRGRVGVLSVCPRHEQRGCRDE